MARSLRVNAALNGRRRRMGVGAMPSWLALGLALWLALAGGWAAAHRAAHALHGPPALTGAHTGQAHTGHAHTGHAHADGAHAGDPFAGHTAGSDECRWLDHLGSGEGAVPVAWLPFAPEAGARPPAACPPGRVLPAPGAFQARAPPAAGGRPAAFPA